jgi:hypothetical protein
MYEYSRQPNIHIYLEVRVYTRVQLCVCVYMWNTQLRSCSRVYTVSSHLSTYVRAEVLNLVLHM